MRKCSEGMSSRSGGGKGGAQLGHYLANNKKFQFAANGLLRSLLNRTKGK